MKQQELIVLGLAGLAVYMIWRSQKGAGPALAADAGQGLGFSLGNLSLSNGWTAYPGGVLIDPFGGIVMEDVKFGAGASGSW